MTKLTPKEILEELNNKDIRDVYLQIKALGFVVLAFFGLLIVILSPLILLLNDIFGCLLLFFTGTVFCVVAALGIYRVENYQYVLKISRGLDNGKHK